MGWAWQLGEGRGQWEGHTSGLSDTWSSSGCSSLDSFCTACNCMSAVNAV